MQTKIVELNGLKFHCRIGTSDEKTVQEVIGRDVYQKRGIVLEKGEHWVDLGANIGAFTVLALSKGCKVSCFEPDPYSFELLCKNIELNGYEANVNNKAVVANNKEFVYLNISKTNQFWRNSIEKYLGGQSIKVDSINFNKVIENGDCVKMDIEGSEMPIIDKWNIEGVKKMVFEWSFDIDDDIDRYRKAISKIENYFKVVKYDKIKIEHKVWQKSWFPPCKNIYCYN